jgi:hypothetical protein
MLDVHAPHGSSHGWREFLTHIAAIAIGLLLALALEKTAEYLHERHQLAEARRELAAELEDNHRAWQKNEAEAERAQRALVADLRIIQALRAHTVPEGRFNYSADFYATRNGSWEAVGGNNSLALMPHEELGSHAWFYHLLGTVMEALHALEPTMKIAGAIAASAQPEKITAHDLDELANRTMEAQGRLENLRMLLEIERSRFDTAAAQGR